jgi:branched-subunit amino acid transport protein AzlD
MLDSGYIVGVALVMALVTFGLRALPFLAAQWLKKHTVVQYLGQFLPLAIMTLLLLHSLVGAASEHAQGPWPELLAVAIVVLMQWKSHNPLLSIVAGTALYVLLRNFNGG